VNGPAGCSAAEVISVSGGAAATRPAQSRAAAGADIAAASVEAMPHIAMVLVFIKFLAVA
jgi:hypothetical protein